jgi:outer membrane protein OmpA-like peptidoglycan-associated protein
MKIKFILFALFLSSVALAQDLKRDFQNYEATRLGDNINTTSYHEIIPVISDDNELMYFSRRNAPENVGGIKDRVDVWWIKKDSTGTEWSDDLHHMESKLNNKGYNFISATMGNSWRQAVIGQVIFDDVTRSGPSTTTYDGEFWSKPEKMMIEDWYNDDDEVHYHMTENESIMLISAKRADSKGEKDLYVVTKTEEGWSAPKSLGNINTAGDDVTPFMDYDNKTLYFSTDGRGGAGSYDVFRTTMLDDTWTNWSEPESIGESVNTAESEMYFYIAKADDYAYFSRGEMSGDADIFILELLDLKEVLVTGTVTDSITGKPLPARVLYVSKDGKTKGEVQADANGKYEVTLPTGMDYTLTPRYAGYIAKDFSLAIPERPETNPIVFDMAIPPVPEGVAAIVYFAFDKYEFTPEYFARLDAVYNVVQRYEGANISLEGHTDSVGPDVYNQALSERRATSVARYYTDLGLPASKTSSIGYGEKKPADTNSTSKGRQNNRRVEVVISLPK